ncbi:site-specific DNA recombinase [Vibrio crassostreae]|nr:site-specific DNA recombinase [Vibrio crassostreae]
MTDFITYGRVSTKTQLNDGKLGKEIQLSPVQKIVDDHQGKIVNEYFDSGLSAFKGEHMAEGAGLKEIYDDVLNDRYKRGTVLLMYSLDRFSRQEPEQATHYFTGLKMKGVSIWTYIDGLQKYDNEWSLFEAIIKLKAAHEESAKKAARLRDTWQKKYEILAKGEAVKMTQYPFWISFNETTKKYEFNEFAATAICILEDYLNGVGRSLIVKRLNQADTPFYTKQKKPTKPQLWTRDHLKKLFNNHAIYGRFDSKRNGVSIECVFPELITKEQFDVIQSMKKKRKGKQSDDFPNLFNGLLKCGYCGGSMTRRRSSNGSYSYLCVSAERCDRKKSVAAKLLDPKVLKFLQDLDWSFMQDGENKKPLLESQVAQKRKDIEVIEQTLDKAFDPYLLTLRSKNVEELEALQQELDKEQTTTEQYDFDTETLLTATNDLRLKANKAMLFLIDKMEVYTNGLHPKPNEPKALPHVKVYFKKYIDGQQQFKLIYLTYDLAIPSSWIVAD